MSISGAIASVFAVSVFLSVWQTFKKYHVNVKNKIHVINESKLLLTLKIRIYSCSQSYETSEICVV